MTDEKQCEWISTDKKAKKRTINLPIVEKVAVGARSLFNDKKTNTNNNDMTALRKLNNANPAIIKKLTFAKSAEIKRKKIAVITTNTSLERYDLTKITYLQFRVRHFHSTH